MPRNSHPDVTRTNVLVVGPEEAPFVRAALELSRDQPTMEVVARERISDALHLLRRASVALVVLDGQPVESGSLELILEGLQKTVPPRFLVASSQCRTPTHHATLGTIPRDIRPAVLRTLLEVEPSEGLPTANHPGVCPRDLLAAAADFPDAAWLRIMHPNGQTADLCVAEGKAIYCELGQLKAIEALWQVLSWPACLYEYRELPSFLQHNLDRPLREITGAPPRTGSFEMPPARCEPAAAHTSDPVLTPEEPTEFAVDFAAQPTGQSAWELLEEPEEPAFADFGAQPSAASADSLYADLEEPSFFPDFSAEPADPHFASIAVIKDNGAGLESCRPAAEESCYDARALREVWNHARHYAQLCHLTPVDHVQIVCAGSITVVASIPGSERLVAARVHGSTFGAAEEAALRRIRDSLALADPVASGQPSVSE